MLESAGFSDVLIKLPCFENSVSAINDELKKCCLKQIHLILSSFNNFSSLLRALI
jgi:hypothetical protein